MNKKKLIECIQNYHKNKGIGRKYFTFFYDATSREMGKLIRFTQVLPNGGMLTAKELERLQQILNLKLKVNHKPKPDDGTLTTKIFLEIQNQLDTDPVSAHILANAKKPKKSTLQSITNLRMPRVFP